MPYRVMLADDEPIMRKALLTLADWKKMDCEVVYTASNGEEVIRHLESASPDILITDIKMPGKDGIELAKYIWENALPIKVIILTGYADFSYAQQALKYNAVDYVIKAGAFDGLMTAVAKAKADLDKTKGTVEEGVCRVHTENFLKAVFDGSLYVESEIRAASTDIGFLNKEQGYIVATLRFRLWNENKIRGGKTIYESLTNFFSMVFGEQLLGAVSMERDTFVLVLSREEKDEGKELLQQCGQIIDMMDNFMRMYAYIGIGKRHTEVSELKKAYNEADEALEYSFIDEESKINFYRERNRQEEVNSANVTRKIKELYIEIERGRTEDADKQFEELVKLQKDQKCSIHLIKNSGISIQNRCRSILAAYDKTIYEVTGIEESISKTIYRCRFLKEYVQIMGLIVNCTAQAVHIAVNKKKSLIQDCQKFIEENYAKNILVTDVAKHVGASPSYLSRVFKDMTGQTIIATLNQKKLEKAKEYLENTDMKIFEIADALGFENTTYFSHFFKKYTNVSPKEYKGGYR